MTKGPIANLRSRQKPKESSILDELSKPLRDFVADFKAHGADALKTVRERDAGKYLELATKLLPLVAALNPAESGFAECKSMEEIGIKLLKSVGADEYELTPEAVAAALDANNRFIEKLQQIRAEAEGAMN